MSCLQLLYAVVITAVILGRNLFIGHPVQHRSPKAFSVQHERKRAKGPEVFELFRSGRVVVV